MRIRTVKPEFFSHPEIVRLTIPARLLLVALFTQADDEGRLYDQPMKIRANSFGDADRVRIGGLLDELAREGRIVRYGDDGKRLIQIVHFDLHQKPSKFRPSSLPPPGAFPEPSGSAPDPLPPSSGGEGKGREGKGTGNREPGMEPIEPAKRRRERDPLFDALADIEGSNLGELTRAASRTIGVALAEIRKASPDVTADEIRRRAGIYRQVMPSGSMLTASALAKHWPHCGVVPPPGSSRRDPRPRDIAGEHMAEAFEEHIAKGGDANGGRASKAAGLPDRGSVDADAGLEAPGLDRGAARR